jgi:hypothetical protein
MPKDVRLHYHPSHPTQKQLRALADMDYLRLHPLPRLWILHEMRAIPGLLQLVDYSDNDIVVNSFCVDLGSRHSQCRKVRIPLGTS